MKLDRNWSEKLEDGNYGRIGTFRKGKKNNNIELTSTIFASSSSNTSAKKDIVKLYLKSIHKRTR